MGWEKVPGRGVGGIFRNYEIVLLFPLNKCIRLELINRFKMSIRNKTFLVILFGLLLSIGVGFVSMYFVISDRFENIEQATIEEKSTELANIITSGIESTNLINKDWSKWDDTYEFAQDGNQDYIDSNLTTEEFGVLKLNAIQVIDKQKKVVYYGSWNYQDDQVFPNDEDLQNNLSRLVQSLSFKNIDSSIFGYFGTDNIYYFAAHQITKSVITDNSDVAGVLIFAKEIDYSNPENFGLIAPPNSTIDLLNFKAEKGSVNLNKTNSKDPSKLVLDKEILDYFGEPILIFRIQMDRVYTTESLTIFIALFIVLLLVFSLFGMLIYYSINRTIFSKLAIFSNFLNRLIDPMTTQERLKGQMGSEFSRLQETINELLDNIQSQRKEVDKVNNDFRIQNEQLQARQKELDDRNAELSSLNQAMIGREMRMIELKTQMDALNKKVDIIDINNPNTNP